MIEIKYRNGEYKDSQDLAKLIYIASDGIIDFLLHGLTPGLTPVQVITGNYQKNNYPHTFESAIVASHNSNVAGAAISFPASFHKITKTMTEFFPAERLAHMQEFYSSRVEDSLFLSTLCVFEEYRKKGIGSKLIEMTKQKAVDSGFDSVSLLVFQDNALAIPIYRSMGFDVVKSVDLKANEFIQHEGGCFLMKCECKRTDTSGS